MYTTLGGAFILSLPAHASPCLVIDGKQIFDSNSGTASFSKVGGAWVEVEKDKITETSLGSRAPRLLGMTNKIGVLKLGAFADIIGIEGNPLERITEIHKVRLVMKNGQTLRHK